MDPMIDRELLAQIPTVDGKTWLRLQFRAKSWQWVVKPQSIGEPGPEHSKSHCGDDSGELPDDDDDLA